MQDNLAIIRRIIEEHRAIRGHIKLIGDSTSDREAMNALTRARADWIPGRQEILSEKQKRLEQTLSLLDEGLKNHFYYEERYLPPLLGDLLMRALLLDHGEIRKEIDEAKSIVTDTKLEGLSREDLLPKESRMNRIINNICQVVEEHATNEEILLEMLERALEEKE